MTSVSPNVRPVYLLVEQLGQFISVDAVSTDLQRLKDAVADLEISHLWMSGRMQIYIIRASTYVDYGPRFLGVLPCTEDGAVNEDDPRMICKCMVVVESGGVLVVNFVDNPDRDETCIPSTNEFYVAGATCEGDSNDLFIATTVAHARRYVNMRRRTDPTTTHSICKVDQNDLLAYEDDRNIVGTTFRRTHSLW
jgi:hypothetical protein